MKILATETRAVCERKATAVLTEIDNSYRHALVLKIETPLTPGVVKCLVEYDTKDNDTCEDISYSLIDKMTHRLKRVHRYCNSCADNLEWEDFYKACDTAIDAAVGATLATL